MIKYTDPPQSRNEEILKATIDGTSYDKEPQSRIEDLLIELKAAVEGGGGGGTTNYNNLENRPQINSHTLEGDMSFEDLGIDETPTEDSTNAVSSGGVYAGLTDKIDKSSSGYETITGNPLEFESPSPQIVGMKCDIEPSQDLHGYDKPWAGGEGKNKLPMTVESIKAANTDGTWSGNEYTNNGVSFTILTDSDNNVIGIKVNGNNGNTHNVFNVYKKEGTNFPFDDTTYYLTGAPLADGAEGTYKMDGYYQVGAYPYNLLTDWGSGGSADFSILSESNATYLSFRIVIYANYNAQNLIFRPMIRLATETDPTFEPYSNICPIAGVDEVSVQRSGKNHVKGCYKGYPRSLSNTFVIDNDSESALFYAIEGKTYISSASVGLNRCVIAYAGTDNIVNGMSISSITNLGDNVRTWTASWTGWTIWYGYAGSSAEVESYFQVEFGTEATPYEPYQGGTYTIDLDGTRYGGQLDVTSGVLTLTYGEIASYDGETLPSEWISDRDEYQAGTTPTTGAQVVYELATPQTIQLTPTQVWAVQGGNTITVSVDGVEAEIHSSNYATLKDINDLWEYIKQSPQGGDGVKFGASNLEMIGGTMP